MHFLKQVFCILHQLCHEINGKMRSADGTIPVKHVRDCNNLVAGCPHLRVLVELFGHIDEARGNVELDAG
jgi:hypothetical protein